jgi:hypothetical protein
MKQVMFALLAAASFSQQTASPPPPPAKPDLVQLQQLEIASVAALIAFQEQLDGGAAPTRDKCMNALGSAAFCGCLTDNLPRAVDFPTYVRIATSTPEELGYAALSAGSKKLVDDAVAVRDKCVAKVFPPKAP